MKMRTALVGSCLTLAMAMTAATTAAARDVRIVVGVPQGSAAHYGVDAFAADLAARIAPVIDDETVAAVAPVFQEDDIDG